MHADAHHKLTSQNRLIARAQILSQTIEPLVYEAYKQCLEMSSKGLQIKPFYGVGQNSVDLSLKFVPVQPDAKAYLVNVVVYPERGATCALHASTRYESSTTLPAAQLVKHRNIGNGDGEENAGEDRSGTAATGTAVDDQQGTLLASPADEAQPAATNERTVTGTAAADPSPSAEDGSGDDVISDDVISDDGAVETISTTSSGDKPPRTNGGRHLLQQ
jgi:hypothetical protein